MAKEDSVLAIDIGGSGLKIAEFVFPPTHSGMELRRYEFKEYDVSDGENDFVLDFTKAFREIMAEKKFLTKKARVAISGQNFFTRLSKLPPVTERRSQVAQIVEFEARQTVPYPMEEVVWDYQLIKHTQLLEASSFAGLDDAAPADNGQTVDEMEALFVAIKADLLSALTDVIEDAGIDILSVEIAPTAFFNAARANQIGKDQCDVILNIGGRCSNLVFVDRGRIFSRTIPIAGHAITQQIAKEFNISFSDAEELKRRHCFVALGGAYEDPDSEVAATISKIARNVMTRLHGEVNRSINVWRSQHNGNRPQRMLLCGGSSIIPYAPHFFNEKLRIPVEYLNVFQVVTLPDTIDREHLLEVAPMFPELIGLGLRHAISCPVEISLMPLSIRRQHALNPKKPYFYASAVIVFLCLWVTYGVAAKREKIETDRVKSVENDVEFANKLAENVRKVNSEYKKNEGNYDEALSMINARGSWLNILKELNRMRPDLLWYSTIVPEAEPMLGMGMGMGGMGGMSMGMGGMGMGGGMGAKPSAGGMGMPGAATGGGMGMPGAGMGGMGMGGGMGMPGAGMGGMGMGGMGADGMGMGAYVEPKTVPGEVETLTEIAYIAIRGHWLVAADEVRSPIEVFRARLKDSELFELDETYPIEVTAGSSTTNVSEFTVKLKLKEPLKQ